MEHQSSRLLLIETCAGDCTRTPRSLTPERVTLVVELKQPEGTQGNHVMQHAKQGCHFKSHEHFISGSPADAAPFLENTGTGEQDGAILLLFRSLVDNLKQQQEFMLCMPRSRNDSTCMLKILILPTHASRIFASAIQKLQLQLRDLLEPLL